MLTATVECPNGAQPICTTSSYGREPSCKCPSAVQPTTVSRPAGGSCPAGYRPEVVFSGSRTAPVYTPVCTLVSQPTTTTGLLSNLISTVNLPPTKPATTVPTTPPVDVPTTSKCASDEQMMIVQCNDYLDQGQEFDRSCTPGPICIKQPAGAGVDEVQATWKPPTPVTTPAETSTTTVTATATTPEVTTTTDTFTPQGDIQTLVAVTETAPATPFYKKAWFWAVVGGGGAALGTGGYFIFRKKR